MAFIIPYLSVLYFESIVWKGSRTVWQR